MTFVDEWRDIVESQVRGVRIFSQTLLELVEHDRKHDLLEGTQLNRMEKLANDLKNFIEPFADKVFV